MHLYWKAWQHTIHGASKIFIRLFLGALNLCLFWDIDPFRGFIICWINFVNFGESGVHYRLKQFQQHDLKIGHVAVWGDGSRVDSHSRTLLVETQSKCEKVKNTLSGIWWCTDDGIVDVKQGWLSSSQQKLATLLRTCRLPRVNRRLLLFASMSSFFLSVGLEK